jgi:hypothetical protein
LAIDVDTGSVFTVLISAFKHLVTSRPTLLSVSACTDAVVLMLFLIYNIRIDQRAVYRADDGGNAALAGGFSMPAVWLV